MVQPIEGRAVARSLELLTEADGVAWWAVQLRTWRIAEARASGATWEEIAQALDVNASTLKSSCAAEVRELIVCLDDGLTFDDFVGDLAVIRGRGAA